jgi:hypothetical protein
VLLHWDGTAWKIVSAPNVGRIEDLTAGGPAARPYFRPGAPATRAQTAKIVVNTFIPSEEKE